MWDGGGTISVNGVCVTRHKNRKGPGLKGASKIFKDFGLQRMRRTIYSRDRK